MNPHLHNTLRSAKLLEQFDHPGCCAAPLTTLGNADFVEEHHSLLTIHTIKQVSYQVTNRLVTLCRYNQIVLRSRKKPLQVIDGQIAPKAAIRELEGRYCLACKRCFGLPESLDFHALIHRVRDRSAVTYR